MNANKARTQVYEQLASLLSGHQDQITTKLIEKGCRPETAKKVHNEIWRELFHKSMKQPAIRLSRIEQRMLDLCVDGSERFDFIGKAWQKRGEKLVKLGFLRAEDQTNSYGLEWTKYTTTEAGKAAR